MKAKITTPLKSFVRRCVIRLTSVETVLTICEPFFYLKRVRDKEDYRTPSQAKRILVVRLDEIGDVVMTTPLLRELRRLFAEAWISLVVKSELLNLIELCPYVDEVLTYDGATPRRFQQARRHFRALSLGRSKLWPRRFDLAIVPRWGVDLYHGAFLAYFSGARCRLGYSEKVSPDKERVNQGSDALFTHLLNDGSPRHDVQRNLEIVRYLGGETNDDTLELWSDEADERFVDSILSSDAIRRDALLVAIAPGAGAAKRRWPITKYIELAQWLKESVSASVVIVGGIEDQQLGRDLQTHLGETVVNVTGRLSLRQTFALLKHCDLYVGNDTGPMHLSAAAGVPVVEISCHPRSGSPNHPNSPVVYGPWGASHVILQPSMPLEPCEQFCAATEAHCIVGVGIDEVKQAVSTLVDRTSSSSYLPVQQEHLIVA